MDKSRGERGKADETNTVSLPLDEVNMAITSFIDNCRLWEWRYRRRPRDQHVPDESNALIMVPERCIFLVSHHDAGFMLADG